MMLRRLNDWLALAVLTAVAVGTHQGKAIIETASSNDLSSYLK
jgi:hypothetical protein